VACQTLIERLRAAAVQRRSGGGRHAALVAGTPRTRGKWRAKLARGSRGTKTLVRAIARTGSRPRAVSAGVTPCAAGPASLVIGAPFPGGPHGSPRSP